MKMTRSNLGLMTATVVGALMSLAGGAAFAAPTPPAPAFTPATEDARAIVNYIHEYAIPAEEAQ